MSMITVAAPHAGLYKNVCLFSFQIWAQNRTHHFHKIGHQIHLAVSLHSINSDSWRRFLSPWLRCLCILLLPFKLHCFWMFALLDLSITSWCPDSRFTSFSPDCVPRICVNLWILNSVLHMRKQFVIRCER